MQENELVTLLLGTGVLVFVLLNRKKLAEMPGFPLVAAAYGVLLAGWVFTVLEGLFWPDALNALEHTCYAGSAILLALWFSRVPPRRREPR